MKIWMASLFLSVMTLKAAPDFFELPPIRYSETASDDEISRWEKEIAADDWVLPKGGSKEFLRVVLDRLNIPEESQVLVFSKTSLQNGLISQRNPRVLYFSQDAYVGWVPGGKIEVIVEDEKLGPVFYVLRPPVGGNKPEVVRATDSCLQCHANSRTEGVPGMLIRSVIPDENSHPILSQGTTLVHHGTPVRERWGGWYVTGKSDGPHLGNRWTSEGKGLEPTQQSLKDLGGMIDTDKYLRPTSDIVALMVLEHQCRVHNLLTKAKLNFRRSEWFQKTLQTSLKLDDPSGMSWKTAEQLAKDVVAEMLFKGEAPLEGDGIKGGDAFANAFVQRGVIAQSGKGLRRLKLYGRLFKYRCSYMIYSKAFRSLPPLVKKRVMAKLREALSEEGVQEFSYLGGREKQTIREILKETVTGF